MTLADRLKPYQVAHALVHRLERYRVSEVPRPFRHLTWNDLRFWALLLDEDDERLLLRAMEPNLAEDWNSPEDDIYDLPPEEWFGRVEA